MRKSLKDARHEPPRESSPASHTGCVHFLQQWVVTTPGTLVSNSLPRVFTGDWSHRHPLPSGYPKSRLPEGAKVLSINESVPFRSMSHSDHGTRGGNPPDIQVSDTCGGRAGEQDLLRKVASCLLRRHFLCNGLIRPASPVYHDHVLEINNTRFAY